MYAIPAGKIQPGVVGKGIIGWLAIKTYFNPANSQMETYLLGVDIGTGSCKSVAITATGKLLASNQVYYPQLPAIPGHSEQDPRVVCSGFIECVREVIKKMGYPPLAISLSAAMHGVMAVDKNGEPLTPLILWSDTRAEAIARKLRLSEEAQFLYETT